LLGGLKVGDEESSKRIILTALAEMRFVSQAWLETFTFSMLNSFFPVCP